MPTLDSEQGRLIVRIVYDGPARAGKTTNLRRLCESLTTARRGPLVTPEERDGRTLLFDWLQVEGGIVGGYPLRCQIVTVPGQAVLSHRRRFLLEDTDAIVFVCESTREGVEIGSRLLPALVDDGSGELPPLVVQANKQDLANCLTPEEVCRGLGVPRETPVVGAEAQRGAGVRETVVLAIRAAAGRAQRLLARRGEQDLVGRASSVEELRLALESVTAEQGSGAQRVLRSLERVVAVAPAPGERHSAEVDAAAVARPGRSARPPLAVPEPPDGSVPSGWIWPAAEGREALRHLSWTEADSSAADVFAYRCGQWLIRTSHAARWPAAEAARDALVRAARLRTAMGALRQPASALCLSRASDGAVWMWSLAPDVESLEQQLQRAADRRDGNLFQALLTVYADAVTAALELRARHHIVLDLAPASFADGGDGPFHLDAHPAASDRTQLAPLIYAADRYASWPIAVETFARNLCQNLAELARRHGQLPLVLLHALSLVEPESDAGRRLVSKLASTLEFCS